MPKTKAKTKKTAQEQAQDALQADRRRADWIVTRLKTILHLTSDYLCYESSDAIWDIGPLPGRLCRLDPGGDFVSCVAYLDQLADAVGLEYDEKEDSFLMPDKGGGYPPYPWLMAKYDLDRKKGRRY